MLCAVELGKLNVILLGNCKHNGRNRINLHMILFDIRAACMRQPYVRAGRDLLFIDVNVIAVNWHFCSGYRFGQVLPQPVGKFYNR